jgi:hypothetical protein
MKGSIDVKKLCRLANIIRISLIQKRLASASLELASDVSTARHLRVAARGFLMLYFTSKFNCLWLMKQVYAYYTVGV